MRSDGLSEEGFETRLGSVPRWESMQKTPPFSIRPATEEDLPKIAEIESRVHSAPWDLSHFREELTKPYSHFYVMTDDDTDEIIVGYIIFWMMGGEGSSSEILNVVVDFPYRGLGMAKKLMLRAISTSVHAGAKRMILDVRKSNMSAIQLYQSLRFSITHVRKSFYSNGEDAYGMLLSLDDSSTELGNSIDF